MPGIEPGPWRWKRQILTTRPHGTFSSIFHFPFIFWEDIKGFSRIYKKKWSQQFSPIWLFSKDMVMKNILKYSDKYLTVEVIQGKKLFQIRYSCVGGESNPGPSRGRREFYHWTTNAFQRSSRANSRVLLISRCHRRIVSVVKILKTIRKLRGSCQIY